MKFTPKSDHPVTNEAAKAATGKTLDQWFAELDKADGLKLGRREINNRLYEQKARSLVVRDHRRRIREASRCAQEGWVV